jgi:hypothetical protein
MSQVAKLSDPYQRELSSGDNSGMFSIGEWNSLKKSWAQNIPGLRESMLYPKVDTFGNPVPAKEWYGVYAEHINKDPVYQAFKTSGYFPTAVPKDINGYKLSEEQYHEFAVKAGQAAKELLDNDVKIPGFENFSAVQKHDILQRDVQQARKSAQADLMTKYQDIPEESVKMKKELAEGLQ